MAPRLDDEAPLLGKPGAASPPSPPAKRTNKYPFFCAVLASMTSVLAGYNVAVMSGAQIFMAVDLGVTDAQVEVLSGVINICSLVGALLAGWTSDHLGRRLTIVLANVFFLVGPLAMTLAGGYAVLMAGRFVAGVGVGYAFVIAPVYAAEIAPASSRGLLSSLPEVTGAAVWMFLASGGGVLRPCRRRKKGKYQKGRRGPASKLWRGPPATGPHYRPNHHTTAPSNPRRPHGRAATPRSAAPGPRLRVCVEP